MIAEQVRAQQEREHNNELIKVIQKLAKRKGEPTNDELVEGYRYQEGNLIVSSTVYSQPQGDWHFVTVLSQDRPVFTAGALKTRQARGPLDFSISSYRPGPWESHIRRLVRTKPKGKR